jgi:hypothetical protein
VTGGGGTVTAVTGTAPIASSGGTTPDISISNFTSSDDGAVPASGGGTTNFLRADGTWAAVGGAPAGSDTQLQYNDSGSFGADAELVYDSSTQLMSIGVSTDGGIAIAAHSGGTGALKLGNVNVMTGDDNGITAITTGYLDIITNASDFKLDSDGTWYLNSSAGTLGQVLTSGGVGAQPTWATPAGGGGTVTSVAMSVPSFLSVSGSPITTSGTLAMTLSGTALPVANGGTGATTLTGILFGNGTGAITGSHSVNLSSEVTGNLGVSHLNSGTSATSSTFWRGDGVWATPAGGGTVTSVTGTAPIVSSGGSTPAISITGFTSSVAGSTPASGGGTTNFLRADGTWAVPPGGSATPSGSNTQIQYNNSGSFGATAQFTYASGALSVGTSIPGAFNLGKYTGGSATINIGENGVITGGGATTISGTQIQFYANNGTQSFEIDSTGAWNINGAPGTLGQVITSAGTGAPPTWTTVGGSSSNTYKEAVRVATTANGTLSTAYANGSAVDGVTLATNDRVLIKNQTTASENGIYTVNASGSPTRATDFNTTGAEVANGAIIPIQFGTVNGGSTWQLVTNGGTIGNSFVFSPLGGILRTGLATATTPTSTGTSAIVIGNAAVGSSSASGIAIGASATLGTLGNAVAIGSSTSATGNGAVAIGSSATSSNTGSISIMATTSSGLRGVAIGSNSTNSKDYSTVIGCNATTDFSSQTTFTGPTFSTIGDASIGPAGLWMTTTNATATEMGNGNIATAPTSKIVLLNNSAYIFDCDIVARQNTTGDTSAWNLKFAIKRGANAAATALLGSPVATLIAQDTGAALWAVGVTADTTNGRPNISVTGEASKTIRWVANINMTKVSG